MSIFQLNIEERAVRILPFVPWGGLRPPRPLPCPIVRTECVRTIGTRMPIGRLVGFGHVIDRGVDRENDCAVGTEKTSETIRSRGVTCSGFGSAPSAVRPFNPPYPTDTWRLWRDTFVHRFPGEVYLPLPLRRPNHCRRPDATTAFIYNSGKPENHRFCYYTSARAI